MSEIRVIRNGQPQLVRVVDGQSQLVRVISEGPPGPPGPQGPQGPSGITQLSNLQDVDASGLVDRSMLIYDALHGVWVANSHTTTDEILNGGNY